MKIKVALFVHIYYQDSWESFICEQINKIKGSEIIYFFNLCNSLDIPELTASIKKSLPDAYIIATPNKGKDVGGKLALMDLYLLTGVATDFIIFLHDKKSPHSLYGDRWREKLFKIIRPEYVKKITAMFGKEPSVGIIGAKEFILNESVIRGNEVEAVNRRKTEQLAAKYNIHTKDFRFIGGTMFWVRSIIYIDFFKQFAPLECRKLLEQGNVMDMELGTYTHSWERLFCHIATARFKMKGV